jgi:hypothetical protein
VKPPQDPPFYPGTWLLAFLLLTLLWIYVDVWIAIAAFFGLLVVQAAAVALWLSARLRTRG